MVQIYQIFDMFTMLIGETPCYANRLILSNKRFAY